MSRVATYVRRSKPQPGRPDTEKSVEDQKRDARAFVAQHRLGTILPEWIVEDDSISGADFSSRALLRLVHAARQQPRPFDVLVVTEPSRVGREQFRTNVAFLDLVESGIAVYLIADHGEPLRLDTPVAKMMLSFRNFSAEDYRYQISQKVAPKLLGKVRRGHYVGGRTYGYRRVEITTTRDGHAVRDHVSREQHPEQAPIVLRTFQMRADRRPPQQIAHVLNAEGIPAPDNPRGGQGWTASTIRDMLRNPLYIGKIVHNKTARVWINGKRVVRPRPHAEWIEIDVPDLAIVPLDLWQQVQALNEAGREAFKRSGLGRLAGRQPGTRVSTPYLLSGLARCGLCEGSLAAVGRSHKCGARARHYRCHLAMTRGSSICTNEQWYPMGDLDRLVIGAINEQAMTDDLIEDALARWNAERPAAESHRTRLTSELRKIEQEITSLEQKLIEAKPGETPWQVVAEMVSERRQRRDGLRAELAQARDRGSEDLDAPALRQRFAAKLAEWRKLLAAADPGQARRALMATLMGERIVVTPLRGGRGCQIIGSVAPDLDGRGGIGGTAHAARVRCSAAAGLHPGARRSANPRRERVTSTPPARTPPAPPRPRFRLA